MIIPARDAAATVDRTLRALSEQEFKEPFEVIVVDDGSRDETASLVRAYEPLVRLIRNDRPTGAGAARNVGVAHARAPVLAFTDADCFPTREWLSQAVSSLAEADLVQGRVEPDPGQPRTPFDRTLSVGRDRGFYQTANLLVRREVFDRVGGFRDWTIGLRQPRSGDSPPRRPIGEDTVFGWTAFRAGARSRFAPDAVVHHVVLPGGIRDAVLDRWNWSTKMAGLVSLVPELRTTVFYRHWFFADWTAWFDLAVAGLVVSGASRRKWPLIAILPYARRAYRDTRLYRARSDGLAGLRLTVRYFLGAPFVDAATLIGFLAGSATWRTLVL